MTTLRSALLRKLHLFAADERGATAIEYALIATGISIVIIGAVTVIGQRVLSTFQAVANAF